MWNILCSMTPIASRISIDEVEAKGGKLRLEKRYGGNMDKLPHMLIAGWYRWR